MTKKKKKNNQMPSLQEEFDDCIALHSGTNHQDNVSPTKLKILKISLYSRGFCNN